MRKTRRLDLVTAKEEGETLIGQQAVYYYVHHDGSACRTWIFHRKKRWVFRCYDILCADPARIRRVNE